MDDYGDLRQEFWRERFETGRSWDDYLEWIDPKHRERWEHALEAVTLSDEQTALLLNFKYPLNMLVLSGAWCGDCVREGPIFKRIADATPAIKLRFIERDIDVEATDELRVNGAKKVPMVVFLTEEFYEVGRFGDRTLSVYRMKAEQELGAACATGIVPPPAEALAAEVRDWVEIAEWMQLMLRTSPRLKKLHGEA